MEKREDDCEVDAGIYEVGLHDMGYSLTFAADYRRNCSGKAAKTLNCCKYKENLSILTFV